MKKLSLLFLCTLTMSFVNAQDLSDAIRYSQDNLQGTARFRALSGAFGALGGDMSAVSINPASSAVFNQSHASFTLTNNSAENNTNYFGGINKITDSNFDLNQGGAAFVFATNNKNNPWRKFSIGIAYDRTNNFNDEWFANGTNTTSIDRYFLQRTEGAEIPFGILKLRPNEFIEEAYADIGTDPNLGYDFQQVFLGYWAGIIDPVNLDDTSNDDNLDYSSNVQGPSNHNYTYTTKGFNGKLAFNFATQYQDNLYLGINLNSHFIDYERSTLLLELNDSSSTANSISFGNNLTTLGRGFSFQLGGILKLSKELRVGITYDSPIWYTIEEELTQGINSTNADSEISFISDITNVYPEYKIQTPGKVTGSIAYVFRKKGLISFDYSHKDYSSTKFRPEADYTNLNNDLSNTLTAASTYKFGTEYKHKQFSFRGGYRFEESPYKNGETIGDLNGFSLGLGYNFGNTRLDITYDKWERTDKTPLYNVGLTDTTTIDRENSNITLSLSFNI